MEINRRSGVRARGAPSIYAFGYMDLAALIGTSPWAVAAAVVDGYLEPLSFVELAIARAHGLDGLERFAETDPKAWAKILDSRPELTRDVCEVYLSDSERPYGLGDLWGFTTADLAEHMGLELDNIHTARKRGKVALESLASVVDYAMTAIPGRDRAKLRLV